MSVILDVAALALRDVANLDQLAVFTDVLKEAGRQDLVWILEGLCPKCGGKFMRKHHPSYACCKKCKEHDVEHATQSEGRAITHRGIKDMYLRRVIRLLGFKICRGTAHYLAPYGAWIDNDKCMVCEGKGIVR